MYFNYLTKTLLILPRTAKRFIVLALDVFLCALTVWLAFYLRLGEWVGLTDPFWMPGNAALVSIGISTPIFIVLGLYRAIFRFTGPQALTVLIRAVAIYGFLYAAIFTFWGVEGVPRTIGLIQPILLLILIGASRIFASILLGAKQEPFSKRKSNTTALIYGAGSAGTQLLNALAHSHRIEVVGFLDDNPNLRGNFLSGLKIFQPRDLSRLVESLGVTDVLLALPNLSRKQRNGIIALVQSHQLAVRTLPNIVDLARGQINVSDIRDLDVEDLLGRDAVDPIPELLEKNIRDKVVLVTGAGGSIGSELCRQILQGKPSTLLLLEQSEFNLYQMHEELSKKLDGDEDRCTKLISVLASVRDEVRMREVFEKYHPQTIYHAAAYKHVPLVEENPIEGVLNNVFGTLVLAKLAIEFEAESFTLISTDKAVRPTNVMGASKRLAELVLQGLANQSQSSVKTIFAMVRFGNVLDSSGSVVPKFRHQIKEGGPITLTHPDVTRYFMTIPEAAQLVIQASAMANGGEVFLLDMGESVKIADLALRMVQLSGLTIRDESNPDGDIEIEITGLRPGEKLYEELLIGENPEKTAHPKVMKAHEGCLPWNTLEQHLQAIESAAQAGDDAAILQVLKELVHGYTSERGVN